MDRKEVLRRAFGFSMSEEGRDKFTDDKRDAGGPTKWGMALNYNRDIIPDKDGNGVIDAADVKQLTEADALVMYEKRYWRPNIKPEYPDALAFMLVDMMLNPGPGATPKLLQQALKACGQKVDVDGGRSCVPAPRPRGSAPCLLPVAAQIPGVRQGLDFQNPALP